MWSGPQDLGKVRGVISVVLFDLDDTLFAHRSAIEDGIVAHLSTIGLLGADVDTATRHRSSSAEHPG